MKGGVGRKQFLCGGETCASAQVSIGWKTALSNREGHITENKSASWGGSFSGTAEMFLRVQLQLGDLSWKAALLSPGHPNYSLAYRWAGKDALPTSVSPRWWPCLFLEGHWTSKPPFPPKMGTITGPLNSPIVRMKWANVSKMLSSAPTTQKVLDKLLFWVFSYHPRVSFVFAFVCSIILYIG